MEMTKLEQFAFDILGDLIPIRAYKIINFRGQDIVLVHIARIGVPTDFVRDEWNNAIKGTEFENVALYTC